MTSTATQHWVEGNQRYLSAQLAEVRTALLRHLARMKDSEQATPVLPEEEQPRRSSLVIPAALDSICDGFALSSFERSVLLLCAGMELDSSFAAVCAQASGNGRAGYPTFALALAAFPHAHWSALTPAAPLRYWRLIECAHGELLTTSALRIDERVLHSLAGVSGLDDRLHGLLDLQPAPRDLVSSQKELAERIAGVWSGGTQTLVQLGGADSHGKRDVAAFAAARAGLRLYTLRAADVPESPTERDALARLWQREVVLGRCALLIDADGRDSMASVLAMVERMRATVLVARDEPVSTKRIPLVRLEVNRPTASEQATLWRAALGPRLNGGAAQLVSQFDFDAHQIRLAAAQAQVDVQKPDEDPLSSVWRTCRLHTRGNLEGLAEPVECRAEWADLVLPAPLLQTLRDIATYVKCRGRVYDAWGFAEKGARGLGVSALFAGASGTGKTMASEVLARELQLDLYRIDLSQIVSKFIGETEKNLRRVFDAAEASGAVLLFDEADALFGKRSEVKDSHDRYANIEVSYLLQRMESYRGLAILTTNMKSLLDAAFVRRLRFIVQFPAPDSAQRAEIWRRIFPVKTPTEGLEMAKLARLNVTGGNIRNIAMHAAFLAADSGDSVRMSHMLRAARHEYSKIERQLTDSECGDWV